MEHADLAIPTAYKTLERRQPCKADKAVHLPNERDVRECVTNALLRSHHRKEREEEKDSKYEKHLAALQACHKQQRARDQKPAKENVAVPNVQRRQVTLDEIMIDLSG
jgi:hypothetical protein